MATRDLSADEPTASSKILADLAFRSRRSMLALIAGAGASALVVSRASASAAQPTVQLRPWDRAVGRYENARDAAKRYEDEVYEPNSERINDQAGYPPSLYVEHTARSGHVARYWVDASKPDGGAEFPFYKSAATVRAKEWNEWLARSRRAEAACGWAAIEAHIEMLDDVERDMRKAMMREPAPDMAALAYKIRLALEGDELWDFDREALRFDADRTLA